MNRLSALVSLSLPLVLGSTVLAQTLVQVVQPVRADLSRQASRPGTVIPEASFDLKARVSGYVLEIPVDDGSEVSKGDLLARLAVPELDAELVQAQAQLAEAEAAIGDADAAMGVARAGVKRAQAEVQICDADIQLLELILRRQQALLEKRGATQEELDEALGQLAMGRARGVATLAAVETAEALVEAATLAVVSAKARRDSKAAQAEGIRAQVGFATLTCPFETAVVTRRYLHTGALVQEEESVILSLARVDRVRVEIAVPEREALLVRPGTPVDLRFDALPGFTIQADISRTTRSLSASKVMTVQVDLDNPDGVFIPGMFLYASILLQEQDGVLTLPASAVRSDQQGVSHVFVVTDGVAQKRNIQTGSDNGIRFAVLQGLTEEDVVIVGGNVKDGSAVRVAAPGGRR